MVNSSQVKELCKTDFSCFCKIIQDDTWFDPQHERLCNFVQEKVMRGIEEGKDVNLLVIMPRGSLKTTMMTRNFPTWLTLTFPDLRFLIATNTLPNARKKLQDIRNLYDQHNVFRTLFPEMLPLKHNRWTDEAAEINRPGNFPEATYEAAGMRTKKVGTHYNVILEDDTVAPDVDDMGVEVVAPSKEDIDRAVGWHRSTTPLFVPKGVRISVIVSTRWSEEDLIFYVRQHEKYDVFQVDALDENGEPNFKIFYDKPALEAIKEKIGPYMFSCLYLNKPLDASLRSFQDAWFQYMTPGELSKEGYYSIAVDPAISEKDSSCESAITRVFHFVTNKERRITNQVWIDAKHGHFNPDRLIKETFDLVELSPTQTKYVIVEANAYQASLKYSFWNEIAARGLKGIKVIPYMSRSKKNERIEGLVPFFAAMKIWFISGLDPQVESQLKQFPHGRLVDIVDSFAMHYIALKQERSLPVKAEKEKEPAQDSFETVYAELKRTARERKVGALQTGLESNHSFDTSSLSTGLGNVVDMELLVR